MRKSECPHWQPLPAVGDLRVDVALPSFISSRVPSHRVTHQCSHCCLQSVGLSHKRSRVRLLPTGSPRSPQQLMKKRVWMDTWVLVKLHILASLPTHRVSKQTIANHTSKQPMSVCQQQFTECAYQLLQELLGKPSFKKKRNFMKLFHKTGVNRISYILFRILTVFLVHMQFLIRDMKSG